MLGWVGFGLVKASKVSHLEFSARDAGGLHPVWAGVLMSAANPYWLIWWLTIGLGYVLFSAKYGLMGVFLFFAGRAYGEREGYTVILEATSSAVLYGSRSADLTDTVMQEYNRRRP